MEMCKKNTDEPVKGINQYGTVKCSSPAEGATNEADNPRGGYIYG